MSQQQEHLNAQRCGIEGCKSRRYVFDERGIAVCRNGHEHPEIRERPPEDEDDHAGSANRHTTRRRKSSVSELAPRVLTGGQAFELYLEVLQLVLRHQIWYLIKEKNLPSEYESLCYSLWALRLETWRSRMAVDVLRGGESDHEPTLFSSEEESEATDSSLQSKASSFSKRQLEGPSLLDTVSLCYMGIWFMQIPVTIGDILDWIQSGEMLYYKVPATIPLNMKDRLPAVYHGKLRPHKILSPGKLHHAVVRIFEVYQSPPLNVTIPRMNIELYLFRLLHDLALPLQTLETVRALGSLVSYEFTYPPVGKSRLKIIDFPEGQLLSLLVVAVKLLFPFNGRKQYPRNPDEPAGCVVDWSVWASSLAECESQATNALNGHMTFEDCLRLTERDTVNLTDAQKDDYLAWYGEVFAHPDIRPRDRDAGFRRYLLDTFPGDANPRQPARGLLDADKAGMRAARLKKVLAAMKVRPWITEEQEEQSGRRVARPGDVYSRYKDVAELEGHALTFHKQAAKVMGLDVKQLVKAVYLTETKLENWEALEWKKRTNAAKQS